MSDPEKESVIRVNLLLLTATKPLALLQRKWPDERIFVNLDTLRNFNVRAKVVGPAVSVEGIFGRHISHFLELRACLSSTYNPKRVLGCKSRDWVLDFTTAKPAASPTNRCTSISPGPMSTKSSVQRFSPKICLKLFGRNMPRPKRRCISSSSNFTRHKLITLLTEWQG